MKKYYVILILLCRLLPVYPVYFKHIGMGEGLSQTSVMSIHQDMIGRMWFGTREGITLYDGSNTTTYKPWMDERNWNRAEALYGNHCDFICSNREGDVFFRTGAALMRYDIRTQEFRMVRSSGIRKVSEYNGNIWCVAEDSLFTYIPEGDSLRFRAKTNIQDIFSMLVLPEDKIWIGTNSGLYLMENGNIPQAVIPDKDIYSIFRSTSEEIWIGTRMEGLYVMAPDGTIRHYREESASANRIASNQIREFTEDSHGNIWFGTFKGLQKYNPHISKPRLDLTPLSYLSFRIDTENEAVNPALHELHMQMDYSLHRTFYSAYAVLFINI